MLLSATCCLVVGLLTPTKPPIGSVVQTHGAVTPPVVSSKPSLPLRVPDDLPIRQSSVVERPQSQAPEEVELPSLSVNNARALLASVAAIYGTNYAAVKILDENIGSPAMAAVLRFSVCVALLLPCLAAAASRFPSVARWPMAKDGLEIGTWFALGYIVQACALEHSPAGVQAFLLSLTVVTCPVLESVLETRAA